MANSGWPLKRNDKHGLIGAAGSFCVAFSKLDPENTELVSLVETVKKDVIADDRPPYDASAKHNVKKTIDNILSGSKTIRQHFLDGKLLIVGALYDVGNGTIDWNTTNW